MVTGNGSLTPICSLKPICSLSNRSLSPSLTVLLLLSSNKWKTWNLFVKLNNVPQKSCGRTNWKLGEIIQQHRLSPLFFLTFFLILFPLLFVFAIIERNTFYRCSKNTDHSTMIQNLYPKFFGLNRISFDLLLTCNKGQQAFKFSAKIYHKLCIFISKLLIVNILINETFFLLFRHLEYDYLYKNHQNSKHQYK